MGVIPEAAAHVISRDLIDIVAAVASLDQARDIITRCLTGDVEAMGVNIGDVRVLQGVVFGTRFRKGKRVLECQDIGLSRRHRHRRSGNTELAAFLTVGPGRQGFVADYE